MGSKTFLFVGGPLDAQKIGLDNGVRTHCGYQLVDLNDRDFFIHETLVRMPQTVILDACFMAMQQAALSSSKRDKIR